MVKLVSAKCPNCGANIEVNKNDDTTRCSYCNSAIIVEDAIAKYKIEVSGKVEVDGITGRNTKLKTVRNHIKVKEYNEAHNLLYEILENDPFDIDAYVERIKLRVLELEQKNHDIYSDNYDSSCLYICENLKKDYDRLVQIDDSKSYVKELKEDQEFIDKCLNDLKEIKDNFVRVNELIKPVITKYEKKLDLFSARGTWNKEIVSKYLVPGYDFDTVPQIALKHRNLEETKRKLAELEVETEKYINKLIRNDIFEICGFIFMILSPFIAFPFNSSLFGNGHILLGIAMALFITPMTIGLFIYGVISIKEIVKMIKNIIKAKK